MRQIALFVLFASAAFSQSLATYEQPTRLLLLDGKDGTVACRIYGNLMSATIPRFSDNWTLESASRSLLRMNNLIAVRGLRGASMVGPVDYLGNLEDPHCYFYTIETSYPPTIYRYSEAFENEKRDLLECSQDFVTIVKAHWIKGEPSALLDEKKAVYPLNLEHSLFRNPGFLEINQGAIELRYFDPRGVDLSSFKARLVENQIPFQITGKRLPDKDHYRVVTYLYEPEYAAWQVQHGSGLFLEKHRFSQMITPISTNSSGFVALAKTNGEPNELELIGVQIPFGYTLIIEEGCIHGDSTLSGFFIMGMTSDHTTMRTADTVFLKFPDTRGNVAMVLIGEEEERVDLPMDIEPPYVIYKNATDAERSRFNHLTNDKSFIFNPFSREYWTN